MRCFGKVDTALLLDESQVQLRIPIVSPPGMLCLSNTFVAFKDAAETTHVLVDHDNIIVASKANPTTICVYECLVGPSNASIRPFSATPPKLRPKRSLAKLTFVTRSEEDTDKAVRAIQDVLFGQVDRPREVLVLVNPFSGKGQAQQTWAKLSEPLSFVPGLNLSVVVTERQHHARDLVRERATLPDTIVVVSGDGLVHEVVSGILSRPDARVVGPATKICHVAGGSSNGLACTLGTEPIASAALAIARDYHVPWDGLAFTIRDSPIHYAFALFSWGLISDIDIGTEWMRKLGPARFTLGAVGRIARNVKYQGRVMVCENLDEEINADRLSEGALGASLFDKVIPRSIDEATEGWEVLPDKQFTLFVASKLSVIDPTFLGTPNVRGWDGKLEMMYGANLTRAQCIAGMDKAEVGEHIQSGLCKSTLISAFILEAHGKCPITADGENVGQGILRGVVLPGALRMVCSQQILNEYNRNK